MQVKRVVDKERVELQKPATSDLEIDLDPPVLTSVIRKHESESELDLAGETADSTVPSKAPLAAPATARSSKSAIAPASVGAPLRPDLLMTPYLANTDVAVSYADPHLPDEPLIDVNDAFCNLTGHKAVHCLLRNCRFLQGEQTRRPEPAAIRQGIKGDFYLITRLLNYRRNGELFDNVLQLGQVRDTDGNTRFLFGLQWDVTRTKNLLGGSSVDPELVDRSLTPELERLGRLANHLVRCSDARGVGAAGVPLVERLAAMSRPFQFPTSGPDRSRPTLRALLDYLLAPHLGVPGSRLRIKGSDGTFDTSIAGPLALWLHELATSSRQYGALSEPTGIVILSWDFPMDHGQPMIAFHWEEIKFGPIPGPLTFDPYAPVNRNGGTGARVAQDIVEFAGGHTETRVWKDRLDSMLTLPNDPAVDAGADTAS